MSYDSIKSILVLTGILIAGGYFCLKVYRLLWVNLRRGQPSGGFNQWGERIKGLFIFVLGQFRLFRFRFPGIAHFLIFWGFLTLSMTILQAILEGLLAFSNPHFVLPFFGESGPFALVQDFFAVFVLIAVVYGLIMRLFVNPERYKGSHKNQGVLVLLFIFTIMLSLLIMNGIRQNLGTDTVARQWRPISIFMGGLFSGFNVNVQEFIEQAAYWVHLGIVLIFLTELPGGKHFHVITSVPAVLLRNLDHPGKLPPPFESEGDVGISQVEQFRWRQMLDFYTCTECGRCQDVCPAYNSSLPLSPKLLMMDLRDNLTDRGLVIGKNTSSDVLNKRLLEDVITEEVIWSCTTCFACDQECPLFIEHVTPIVDMRRHLVIEGQVDSELQDALSNLGRYGNSFGQSERMRANWSKSVQPQIKDARRESVEYLWFLGDYASYNQSLSDVTIKTAEVFQKADLDFGILYESERNSGNDVRRVGEEGLFEMLAEKNMQTLGKCKFKTIITTDPHTYNTLKNEYTWDGNSPTILHYSELLYELIKTDQLKLSKQLDDKVTYHDPCYLSRYNGIYDAPRNVIKATGCQLIEMPRHGDRALCCGAGGGRIWIPEGNVTERPSENRIREAAGINGISSLIVACPKDFTMFRDAVKTTENENVIQIKDLIEIVHATL